ncbi:hypothetical protein K5549_011801 [Capra hircus]|nr:hypothetical protein K5549_011801 [Capra hircus]
MVQNILFRFAESHNLTVALPHPSCEHQFCYPRNFSAHFVHPATGVWENQTLKQGFESQQTFWEVTPRSTDGGKGYKTGRGEATSGASVSK